MTPTLKRGDESCWMKCCNFAAILAYIGSTTKRLQALDHVVVVVVAVVVVVVVVVVYVIILLLYLLLN